MILFIKYVLFLLPFFKPSYISQLNTFNQIYNICQIGVSFFIILDYIKSKKLSSNILLIIFMETIIFISSLLNSLSIIDIMKNIIQTVVLCIIIEDFANRNLKLLFRSLKFIFSILLIINFIFIILYPFGIRVGLYNVWFFGAKNSQIMYILPTLFCCFIYNFVLNKINKRYFFEFLILLIISIYTLYVVNSATSIIVLLLFILLMIFSNNKLYSKVSMKFITIIYLILFFGIVVFQVQDCFSDLLYSLFNKDATFTGRTMIWKQTIKLIKMHPFLGYGLEPSQIRVLKISDVAAVNSHNMILEIIYNGGILLMLVFGYFWLKLCKYVDDYSKNNNQILKSVLIAYLIELLTEVFPFEVFLWILILIIAISTKKEGLNNVTK